MSDMSNVDCQCSELEVRKEVESYYENVFSNKRDRHVVMQRLFPENIDGSDCILDYGCGLGGISDLFVKRYGCSVDAVDISPEELKKAKLVYGQNEKINFLTLTDFSFPESKYKLVFSAQVIEHVHNPGNYLSGINAMMEDQGYLLISIPNVVNLNFLSNLMFFSKGRAKRHSRNILKNYNKAKDHIQGWDPLHFITLCSSCGFELEDILPMEGTPLSMHLSRIPLVGKYIYNLPFTTRLSYTTMYLFKKSKAVTIGNND